MHDTHQNQGKETPLIKQACRNYVNNSAGALGLPWAFREHDVFSTDCHILEHNTSFETLRQFFRQCL